MATPSSSPFPLTGDDLIDAATNGYYWRLGPDRTIRWSLSNGLSGESWSSPTQMAQALGGIFDSISYYANVKFQYAGYFLSPLVAASYSEINIAGDGSGKLFPNSSMWAFGEFPNASINSWYSGAPGDIYVNANSQAAFLPSYAPGSQGYFLFLHEIGHTLGLKHPHDDGGTGRPTFKSLGWGGLDDDWFTVMSYTDDNAWNMIGWDPATPMLIDVLALQYLYGKNMATNAGDSTYTLPINNMYGTIWDASGNDSIDVSGSTTGWVISLPNFQPSKLVDTKAGIGTPFSEFISGQLHTLYWLTGDIENVYGSRYADILTGSDGANFIAGDGGNDVLAGLGGNDTFLGLHGHSQILGGTGSDTLQITLASNQVAVYKLRENSFYIRDGAGDSAMCRDVEKLSLTDGVFDLTNIKIPANIDASLIELYVAAFKRAPELGGYNYWLASEQTGSLRATAKTIFSLDVVKAIYPDSLPNAAFVTAIYTNVFNRQPDQGGLDYWSAQLTSHSRGDLVVDMTAAAMGVVDGTPGKDYFQNRVDWAIYAAAVQSMQNKEIAVATLTSTTTTIDADGTNLLKIIAQWDGAQYT
jgi:Domain of unknown function (DUF4214)/RTX calcium-binding nonapeptide repeat (4 copies)/Metallo-peptidase family M12B Reprolysin-like